MATSVVTATRVKRTKTSAELIGTFTVAVAAGDYTAGGLAVNFVTPMGFTNRKPDDVVARGISGYFFEWIDSTQKLQVRQDGGTSGAAAPLVELAVAATPAALVADTIKATARWYTTPALPAI